MPSFSIPLTGLEADSTALNTIGNNLANLNTTAFKKQNTEFQDLFYQQLGVSGSNDPLLAGMGTGVASTATDFSQGSLTTTSNATDMAVNGNGFFVVQQGGVQELTRAGNFSLDNAGNLITADGQQVMGYPATGGMVNTNAPLTALNIPVGTVEQAQTTQNISLTTNLDSSAATGTQFSTTMTMYDSLGSAHNATVTFTKASPTQWNYSIGLPAADYTGAATNNTGTLTFDATGKLVSPASNVSGIQFAGLTDGASNLNFNWNLYDANSNPVVSQSASSSTVSATNQDGFAAGQYQGFSVDASGVISAQFDNGHTEKIGQVAVATVNNTEGLQRLGNNSYATTTGSGQASIGVAGLGGRGAIADNSLEASNVDISTEFANLIVAQRAFEANSKTVTAFDTISQETINLIR
ncbi:MAG: flagellar hook protein FlgE [Acidobacteriaceae bacterium]